MSVDKDGVLENLENQNFCLKDLNNVKYLQLMSDKKLNQGILPKLKNAFLAVENKVTKVVLMNETKLENQINHGNEGTEIYL